MSGGSTPRSRRTSRVLAAPPTAPAGTSQCATWPVACTPASVRPATVRSTGHAQHHGQRLLQVALDGALAGLPGPAVQRRAVVGDARRRRTSPPPVSVAGSSGSLRVVQRTYLGSGAASPPGALRLSVAASPVSAALISAAAASASSGRDVVALDDHAVLRGRLRGHVAVVLALAVGHEDVGDDSCGRRSTRRRGLDRVGGDLTGGGGRTGTGGELRAAGALGLADGLLADGQRLDQLDDRHGGVVALAGTDLGDAGVATGTVLVARADLGEQRVDDVLVPDGRHHLATGVQVTALGEGHQLLGQRDAAASPSSRWS